MIKKIIYCSVFFMLIIGRNTPFAGAAQVNNSPDVKRYQLIKTKPKLTLDECIEIAVKKHIPLQVAKKQLDLANFRLLEAVRKVGPTATLKFEGSKGVVVRRPYRSTKYQAEMKQPIFYGGELWIAVTQAKKNVEIVKNDYNRIRNELVLQVKKAYYSLDKAIKARRVQEELEKDAGALYSAIKSGYEASVVPQVEYLEVSSQYNQAQFQVISATEDVSIANLILQQAMCINDEIAIAEVPAPKVIDLNLEECFGLAYYNRPELIISRLSIEYFECDKKIMRARANWPRVDFIGSYGNMKEDFIRESLERLPLVVAGNTGGPRDPRNWGPEFYFGTTISLPIWGSTAGYSYTNEHWQPIVRTVHETSSETHMITLKLFDKLEDISSVKEADIEYLRAHDELRKKKQEVELEVRETFFKYKKAVLLMNVARSKVAFQSKQVEIFDIRREMGETPVSDVIEEMIKLAEERFSLLQAIADYFISVATLNKAIGIKDYFEIR